MRIEPFGERIAVKILPIEETTSSGLIVAATNIDSNRGEVVAVNETTAKHFNIGDKVIFLRSAGNSYTDASDDYKILNINDIICKVIEE